MPKVKAVDKPNKEETEALADVDQNKEAPKRGRGRPKKEKGKSGKEEESAVKEAEAGPVEEIENEDLAEHDQIKEVPKKGRGRPKKDQGETEAAPPVKKAKKKVGGSKTVSKISIEFCKS